MITHCDLFKALLDLMGVEYKDRKFSYKNKTEIAFADFQVRHFDGNGDELFGGTKTEACAEKGEKVLVGVYELKEKINVTLEIKEELLINKAD